MRPPNSRALLLAELLGAGAVKPRRETAGDWTWLMSLSWTQATRRRDERMLVAMHREVVANALQRIWPEAMEALARLAELGLRPTPAGWKQLADRERSTWAKGLPRLLHHKTASAIVAPHSKSGWTPIRQDRLGDTELTTDDVLRMRPSEGLQLARGDRILDVAAIMSVTGELILSERGLRDLRLLGRPRALLTVENLGAYVDISPPPGWTVVLMPGWNSALVSWVLREFADVPLVHFGDLDANGVAILRHLRTRRPDAMWFVPSFWSELMPQHAQADAGWPDDTQLPDAPRWVGDLVRQDKWLEQEPLVVDHRLAAELDGLLGHR